MSTPRVACIGECMGELRPANETLQLGFAGDTYNAAVYLRRAGIDVSYVSVVGEDPISTDMLRAMSAQGVDTRYVFQHPTRTIGLYLITTDAGGERSFTYWREQSAARTLLEDGRDQQLMDALKGFDLVYVSGISFGILVPEHRHRLLDVLAQAQTPVAFDPNFRPALWPDPGQLVAVVEQLAPMCRFVKTSLEDEQQLWTDTTTEQVLTRWQSLGAQEIVLTSGTQPVWVAADRFLELPLVHKVIPQDTTGAGDAFGAAYVSARLQGRSIAAACDAAQALAAQVVQVSGALI